MTDTIDLSAFFAEPELNADLRALCRRDPPVFLRPGSVSKTCCASSVSRGTRCGGGRPCRCSASSATRSRCSSKAGDSAARHFYAARRRSGSIASTRRSSSLEKAKKGVGRIRLRHAPGRGPRSPGRARAGRQAPREARKSSGRDRRPLALCGTRHAGGSAAIAWTAGALRQALEIDPDHAPAMFRAARLYDLCGDDAAALSLYDRLTNSRGRRQRADQRGRRVRGHRQVRRRGALPAARAQGVSRTIAARGSSCKSVESCKQMVIEEVGEEPVDARTRLLATPLSEFELSVRARNCLKKMNIRTLGELMRLTEAELLAYKNFGETSLNEIKSLLTKKGLRLGQQPDEVDIEVDGGEQQTRAARESAARAGGTAWPSRSPISSCRCARGAVCSGSTCRRWRPRAVFRGRPARHAKLRRDLAQRDQGPPGGARPAARDQERHLMRRCPHTTFSNAGPCRPALLFIEPP
jgi:hypothetical protein